MQRKTKKRSHPGLIVFFILLIALLTYMAFEYFNKPKTEEPKPEETSQKADDNQTEKPETPVAPAEDPNPDKTPVQNDGDNPNTAGTITGNITYAGVNGNKLIIRVNIDQFINSGMCELTLTSNNDRKVLSAPTMDSASTSTCEGFDIPTDLLSNGTWLINIKVTGDNKTGTITGEVRV